MVVLGMGVRCVDSICVLVSLEIGGHGVDVGWLGKMCVIELLGVLRSWDYMSVMIPMLVVTVHLRIEMAVGRSRRRASLQGPCEPDSRPRWVSARTGSAYPQAPAVCWNARR